MALQITTFFHNPRTKGSQLRNLLGQNIKKYFLAIVTSWIKHIAIRKLGIKLNKRFKIKQ